MGHIFRSVQKSNSLEICPVHNQRIFLYNADQKEKNKSKEDFYGITWIKRTGSPEVP